MTLAIADSPIAPPLAEPCTALKVRRLARRMTQLYDDALASHGITVGQLGLLTQLRRRDGLAIGALAERLGADASTVSRLLKPLAAAGFVRFAANADDRRSRLVLLTDAGADKRRAAIPAWQGAQDRVRERLGDGRLATLRFILDDAHSYLRTA